MLFARIDDNGEQTLLQQDFDTLPLWCSYIDLHLNPNKLKVMILTKRVQIHMAICYSLDGKQLQVINEVCDLRV